MTPQGSQPEAIETLVSHLKKGKKKQVLLGITGSGKTFTMANVIEQYQKNIGREVKVVPVDGVVVKGELAEVTEEEIMVEYSVKERIEGRKKKETIIKQERIKFNNIKETTIIISFK